MKRAPTSVVTVILALAAVTGLVFLGSCRLDEPLYENLLSETAIDDENSGGDSQGEPIRPFMPLAPKAIVGNNPLLGEGDADSPPPALSSSVAMKPFASIDSTTIDEAPSLMPSSITAILRPGQFFEELKTAYIPGGPPLGDILFAIDLTSSMSGELNKVKANSVSIMNAVEALISDTQFGVVSHMDYDGYHGNWDKFGYGSTYGDFGNFGDYPYNRDQSLTGTHSLVESAIDGLSLGYGADLPENYTRVLYESYADTEIGWRDGAKRILLFWQDHIPHDVDPYLDQSQPSSGPDPGRDELDGNGDDLILATVLQGMQDNNITLIALHSSPDLSEYTWAPYPDPDGIPLFDYWVKYAELTGGTAYRINPDGSIPGSIDIATLVADLINAEISHIDAVTLTAPGYEDWLVSVSPEEYTDIDLSTPWTRDFIIRIQVPIGTAPGEYNFDVLLVGDGVEYARQAVSITVPEENQPPIADAGEDQTLEQISCDGAEVTLDGSGATDPDGDDLTYIWSWDSGSAEGVQPVVTLPQGLTTVTLTVEDPSGLSDTDTVVILVEDTTPPVIDFNLVSDTVWPPNHKLVQVASIKVSDVCDSVVLASVVIAVTHNEDPHNNTGVGDGNTEPDWVIEEDGIVWIRAERNGTGTGRIYTITVSAEDKTGNAVEAIAEVLVPHDQGDD